MPLEGRDYLRPDRGGRAHPDDAPRRFVVGALLVGLSLALYGVTGLAPAWVVEHLALSREGLGQGRVWTLLSAALLHADWLHLLSAGGLLWLCGRRLEALYGGVSFGILAGLGSLAAALGYVVYPGGEAVAPGFLGLSGAGLATAGACLWHAPRAALRVGGVELPLLVPAGLYLLLEVTGQLRLGGGGGWFDHAYALAPAALGLAHGVAFDGLGTGAAAPRPAPLQVPDALPADLLVAAPVAPEETLEEEAPAAGAVDAETAQRVDALLERIGREGLGSLSDEERAFLEEASRKYRRP